MIRRLVALLFLAAAALSPVHAERLPIKTYTTEDGLAHNIVNRIVRDSHGFLWFCTYEGLSRFDGYGFSTYRVGDGLPSDRVNDLLETPKGIYWIATANGLVRFDPRGAPGVPATTTESRPAGAMFTTYSIPQGARANTVTVLLRDRSGILWLGTQDGLYRFDDVEPGGQLVWSELGIPDRLEARMITALMEDASGSLWIGATSGLYRRTPDGNVERYSTADGLPDNFVQALHIDREGRFWVGTRSGGLCRLTFAATTNRPVVARVYTTKDGLPTLWINDIFEASDGGLWIGTSKGLLQFVATPGLVDGHLHVYAAARQGLLREEVQSIVEDTSGNLWTSTQHGGAAKLWKNGFTTFGAADGLAAFVDLFVRRSGQVAVMTDPVAQPWLMHSFTQNSFDAVRMANAGTPTWGWHQTVVEDRSGDWWFATREGVTRFPSIAPVPTPPTAVYTTRDGLAADVVLSLFEDSRGDMWIATVGEGQRPSGVSRWERRTRTFHRYADADGLPSGERFYPCAFAEDHSGAVWVGFSGDGGLARYRHGQWSSFSIAHGDSPGRINDLLVDASGRLWAASSRGGLGRVDAPHADAPMFRRYTTAQGLSSNDVDAVIDDAFGRVYVATGQGIDRIEPTTDRIRHYTEREGVPIGGSRGAVRDRDGALWFNRTSVVVRLVPGPDPPPHAPTAVITRLDVGGRPQRISALGEVELRPFEIGAGPGQFEVDFLALGFESGERLRYSYILEGAEDEWSALADQRRVTYAGLGPGTYRFRVRAVNADGLGSEVPASFSLTVWPPVWQRWWFVSLTVLATVLAAFGGHRYRVSRLLEIAHVRTRIATDLHDDIGANLTRIAVLSEVARQQSKTGSPRADTSLASIATVARESVAAMSDIVWAIRPERDRVDDLARRMRSHAEEVFAAGEVVVEVDTGQTSHDAKLPVDVRRDLFLVFKEAVNNAARHASCAHVHVTLRVEERHLVLEVIDDGVGFDTSVESDGNGLASMRRRAERLGARLVVTSSDLGTTVRLAVPIARQRATLAPPASTDR